VALLEVDLERHAVFAHLHAAGSLLVDDRVEHRRADTLPVGDLVVDLHDVVFGPERLVEDLQPLRQALHDAERADVGKESVAVAVDGETAEAVAVGVDHAVGIRDGVELELSRRKATARRSASSKYDSSTGSVLKRMMRSGTLAFLFQKPVPRRLPSLS
jgi:hypothetical protein